MSNVQVLVKAKVLECPVDAVYDKKDGNSTMVVYGKPDPNLPEKWMDVAELIKSIGEVGASFTGGENIIENALPEELKTVMKNIKFRLRQVYLVKKGNRDQKVKEGEESDYAFWLELNPSALTKDWPIDVENVSIKVYTTKNSIILDEMGMTETQKLLEFANSAPGITDQSVA